MGRKGESGFPHKSNKGTNHAHWRNPVNAARGFTWEAIKFLRLFRVLSLCVAMPHRFARKRYIYRNGHRT